MAISKATTGLVLTTAALALLLGACGAKGEPNAQPTGTGVIDIPTTPSETTVPAATPAATHMTTAPPTGPRIVTFKVASQPSCPAGTNVAPIEGKPVKLEWTTAGGVTGTTISIDGPGLYGSYAANDSVELFFGCDGPPNTMATHKYTLTTQGGGATKTQTLTVQAKVNEIPTV